MQAEQREGMQQAKDLSTQAALNEKLAVRSYFANKPDSGYTEQEEAAQRFWENFINNDNFYSSYRDLLESRRERDEEEKRRSMAADSSTQAAMDEKLAERRYWNDFAADEYAKENNVAKSSGVLYNEHTGEIFIPASKANEPSGWETYSLNGKIHVDPKVERRFSWLSNGIAAVLTGATAIVTEEPSTVLLQPIITNLIEAGLLANEYQTQEYIMNNPHTNEVGISLSGAGGLYGGGTISLAADCYGNIAIMHSNDYGAGTPGASAAIFHSRTNAPLVENLQGLSVAVGGSGGPNFSLGADVIGFCNPDTGEAYYGWSVSGGISLWPVGVPAELHGKVSYTTIEHMVSLMDMLYPEKEE